MLSVEKINIDNINDETDIIDDLGFNSITIIKLIIELEVLFGISFDNDYIDIEEISKIKQLVNYVCEKQNLEI